MTFQDGERRLFLDRWNPTEISDGSRILRPTVPEVVDLMKRRYPDRKFTIVSIPYGEFSIGRRPEGIWNYPDFHSDDARKVDQDLMITKL